MSRLAQIVSDILRNLYGIKPISSHRRIHRTQEVAEALNKWRLELSRFLDVEVFSSPFISPLFQRQRNVLNLTYWHAVLLTHRPFLLSSFAKRAPLDQEDDMQTNASVEQCLKAALTIANTIEEISEQQQMFRAFWVRKDSILNNNHLTRYRSLRTLPSPPA